MRKVAATILLAACLAHAPGCGASRREAAEGRGGAPSSGGTEAPATLTRDDRLEIFEGVWQAINDGYYDPAFNGADWPAVRERYRPRAEAAANDQEFYRLLEIMLTELRDAHTVFIAPPSPPQPQTDNLPSGPRSLGVKLGEAEGRVVVVEVEPGSDAERAGVRAGMPLRAVNGKTPEEHFAFIRSAVVGSSSERDVMARMLSALLYGRFLDFPRRLSLTDFDGRDFEVELSPKPVAASANLSARRLASGVGYIRFREWQPPVEEEFRGELAKLSDAPGLVIDLRGSVGGRTEVMLDIAGNFFPAETYCGSSRTRGGELIKLFTRRPERVFRGPVVILVDETTASAAENFTLCMQETGRARVVGRQSAGSTLNLIGGVRHFKGGGKLLFSTQAYLSPSGRNPEGTGVVPDESAPLTASDLRRGRDAALAVAEGGLAGR